MTKVWLNLLFLYVLNRCVNIFVITFSLLWLRALEDWCASHFVDEVAKKDFIGRKEGRQRRKSNPPG